MTSLYGDYTAPAGLRTRGTVLVVAGRGETPASYARFGARLAADAYRVRVLPAPDGNPAEALAAAVAGIPDLVHPLVLAGADTGAAAVAALVATARPEADWWPDAVVLAGLPGYDAHTAAGWDDELDARTHCPAHRGVLTGDTTVQRGALASSVPAALLDAAYGSTAEQPHLLLVGDADPLASRADLARLAKSLPAVRLSVVRGAHHDVLNDLQHRSVAAEVVAFLEAVRGPAPLTPVVHVESSSW
jgi:hypothetical protein